MHGEVDGNGSGRSIKISLPGDNPDMVMTQVRSFINRSLKDIEREAEWTVVIDHVLIFPADHPIDGSYLKARYVHSLDIDGPLVVLGIAADPPRASSTTIHWGPPVDNRRSVDFRNKWGDRTRTDEESGRYFVEISRDVTDPFEMLRDRLRNMKLGSAFEGSFPVPVENELINEVIWEASDRRGDH